tara:strand:+ start:814 stop:1083 length:270 start_codon:yes stop_codon:yes gene_type:complete
MNPKASLQAIDALEKSKGWTVMRKVMEEEIVSSAMAIAESPTMSLDEINFRRGSIFAAKALLDLPQKLRSKYHAEIAIGKDDTGTINDT